MSLNRTRPYLAPVDGDTFPAAFNTCALPTLLPDGAWCNHKPCIVEDYFVCAHCGAKVNRT